ncbi:MAG: DUF3307 domain-containing protein [Chlorobium sp.]|uniref:DUF3307 domain-containing protein n=1 Tax=Chlorobium sp. TaxID=1095 RepID=UPI0025C09C35|nr:DUF3307 domain-containing protein [Chlorobium sp.]MCF8215399.1 DUF3307 domain-containing protein [Chlorobium sp.]MCF8270237.1 DUF3307 domain-containing protein [Chlorobium sp.]MCF8286606.1 DUF3307 domain-containing protein [Chlorobium sp.]MCF8290205.1 DUF3307 domain-containing protein [Chlorobium sp.]MCF8384364.1 DUF3307 domain-containing protein [Chlorobium sp.]
MEKIAVILISAHILGDFVFQPDRMVRSKWQPLPMLLHVAIHGLLAWLLLQSFGCWQVPLFVMLAHGAIDLFKQRYQREDLNMFLIDQALHLMSLLIFASLLVKNAIIPEFSGIGYRYIVEVAGFFAVVRGGGFPVAYFCGDLLRSNNLDFDGLPGGGKYIGYLERALIFLLSMIGQPEGIGFLVAAKSILRFEEAKKQKQAEYIIIGTLLSFSIAIALSSLTEYAMGL